MQPQILLMNSLPSLQAQVFMYKTLVVTVMATKGKYRSSMDGAGTGRWNASHNNTMTQWFVYIPNDTTRTLGGAYYTIANHVHQPPQIPVIQNNWKGQYVSLGWLDVGNNAYARMKNNCTPLGYCGNRIYWDIAKYNY